MSICDAAHGANSEPLPVKTLTTPAGKSLVAMISEKVIAGSGNFSEAITTAVFPDVMTDAIAAMRLSRDGFAGANIATTPIGSGVEKL